MRVPPKKKARGLCHVDSKWTDEFQGIGRNSKGHSLANPWLNTISKCTYIGDTYARCSIYSSNFLISHGGRTSVTT